MVFFSLSHSHFDVSISTLEMTSEALFTRRMFAVAYSIYFEMSKINKFSFGFIGVTPYELPKIYSAHIHLRFSAHMLVQLHCRMEFNDVQIGNVFFFGFRLNEIVLFFA